MAEVTVKHLVLMGLDLLKDEGEDYYHWHLQIIPRLTTTAGFEMGSGIHINPSLPEADARLLSGG